MPAAASDARSVLARWGRACARRPGRVLVTWLLLLLGLTLSARLFGGTYSDDVDLPKTSAQVGADVLAAHQPGSGAAIGQLVLHVDTGRITDHASVLTTAAKAMTALPHVLPTQATPVVSADARTAVVSVAFDHPVKELGADLITRIDAIAAPVRVDGVQVDYAGTIGQAVRPPVTDTLFEIIGIAMAVLVLLLAFGSVLAAALPIVTALLGVGCGVALFGLLAAAIEFATVGPTLAIMMGLGVGIDYGLFLTTRYRQLVVDGLHPVDAIGVTVARSGRAVVVAAVTVVVALFGLFASGISFLGRLGLAASVGVVVASACALSLVPALLALSGRHIDRWRVRPAVAESTGDADRWQRYAHRVAAHPWVAFVLGMTALAVLSVPTFSLTLGHVGAGANPATYTDRRAFDEITEAFGPGANSPFTIVIQPSTPLDAAAKDRLIVQLGTSLSGTSGVGVITATGFTADGQLLTATVLPQSSLQDPATAQLLRRLRTDTLPQVLGAFPGQAWVTGGAAVQLDFIGVVGARLPIIVAVVLLAAFLLLFITFRSPVLALKAALLNLASIGASYGVLVAVFQWGWGSALLGVDREIPIESYVPMMMFALVFGLSMDYEVFLLSRVREAHLGGMDDKASVATGLAATARVISAAALIMASVFLAFLLSGSVVVKMLALGMGVSVLIDATLIRLVVVPAAMFLLGRRNWWLPPWLGRLLPG